MNPLSFITRYGPTLITSVGPAVVSVAWGGAKLFGGMAATAIAGTIGYYVISGAQGNTPSETNKVFEEALKQLWSSGRTVINIGGDWLYQSIYTMIKKPLNANNDAWIDATFDVVEHVVVKSSELGKKGITVVLTRDPNRPPRKVSILLNQMTYENISYGAQETLKTTVALTALIGITYILYRKGVFRDVAHKVQQTCQPLVDFVIKA